MIKNNLYNKLRWLWMKKMKKFFTGMLVIIPFMWILVWVMTYVNTWGFTDDFLIKWLRSFAIVLFIIFPISSFLVKKISRFISHKFKDKNYWIQKIILSLSIWVIMESIMSASTTITNNWLNSAFIINWLMRL